MPVIRRSIALRLSVWFLLLSFLPLGVLMVFVRQSVTANFHQQVLNQQLEYTRSLALLFTLTEGDSAYQGLVAAHQGSNVFTFLLDPQGRYIAHPDLSKIGLPAKADFASPTIDTILSNESGSFKDEKTGGFIGFCSIPIKKLYVVSVTDDSIALIPLKKIEREATTQLAVSLFLISIAGGVGIWLLAGRPLQHLTRVATQIGQGNLDVRADVEDMEDELATLGNTLNQAADRIKSMVQGLEDQVLKLEDAREEIRTLNTDLERRVAERTRQLQTANDELKAFSYSVSHDLRAPLRAIDGFSKLLDEYFSNGMNEQGRGYLDRVRANCTRMNLLIDDMLRLSSASQNELFLIPVNLSQMAQAITSELRSASPQRQVDITITPNMKTDADPNLMRIVLENLLENAWKFTGKRDQACIEFGCFNQQGTDIYYIRDNGAGFNMEYADKLFTPFQRLHREDDFQGNGIGLATVQRIIHRHDGRIWAEANPDLGAVFYFTLNDT